VNPDDATPRAVDRPRPRNAYTSVGGWAGGIVLGNLDPDIKARIGQGETLHVFALAT